MVLSIEQNIEVLKALDIVQYQLQIMIINYYNVYV